MDSSQKDGFTMLKMKRKLSTCDSVDRELEDGSTFMIFAWNKNDPQNNNKWDFHGTNRRTKTALLLDFKDSDISKQENSLPKDFQTFQITPSDVCFLVYFTLNTCLFLLNSLKFLKKILIIIAKFLNYPHPKLIYIWFNLKFWLIKQIKILFIIMM